MATNTGSPWFLPYPESTDDVRPYEDIQALAEEVRDALNTLLNPGWTSYTPALSASGGGASLGNGTLVGEYQRRGDLVVATFLLTVGSTTNFGSLATFISAPVNAHANAIGRAAGPAHVLDAGTIDRAGILKWEDATKWGIVIAEKGVVTPSTNSPQTFAAGDKINGTAVYRPA